MTTCIPDLLSFVIKRTNPLSTKKNRNQSYFDLPRPLIVGEIPLNTIAITQRTNIQDNKSQNNNKLNFADV